MENPSLEDRMVAAHKLGMLTFDKYGKLPMATIVRMLHETGVFETMAEQMAYMAGYHGASLRADREQKPNGRPH